MRQTHIDRLIAGGMLAAATAVATWLVWPAIGAAPLRGVDYVMHLARVTFGMEALAAGRLTDPWYPHACLGFPLFAIRGPGTMLFTAVVRLVGGGSLDPVTALNVVTLGSYVMIPSVVCYAARGFGLDWYASTLAGLLALLVNFPFTEGIPGLFGLGQVEGQVGAIFFWLAVGGLARLAAGSSRAAWMVAVSSSTALILTHLPSTLAVVSVAGLPLAACALQSRESRSLWRVLRALVAATALSAFWLLPLLAHRQLVAQVVAGRGVAPFWEDVQQVLGGLYPLFAGPAAWFVGAACLLVVATGRRWGLRLTTVAVAPLAYYLTTRALYHAHPLELVEMIAVRGMGFAGVLATFPLAVVSSAVVRNIPAVARVVVTAVLPLVVASWVGPLRPLVGAAPPAPAPLPAVARRLSEVVPQWGRVSTPQSAWYRPGVLGTVFPAPDRWLAWQSGRSALGGHTAPSCAVPGVTADATRYDEDEPAAVATRLVRLGVTHVVVPGDDLAERLRTSQRFELVDRIGTASIFSVRGPNGEPSGVTFARAAADDGRADVQVLSDDPEDIELVVSMVAGGEVELALPWWPRWTAERDGAATPLRRGPNGLARLDLPAGRSRLRLTYGVDRWDQAGWLVTGAACSLLAVGNLRRRRRRPTPAARDQGSA